MRYDFPSAYQRSLIGSLPPPTRSSFLRVSPWRSWESGGLFQAGPLFVAGCPAPVSLTWTRVGSLRSPGDPSRALCRVPGPRSNRRVLASDGHVGAAPVFRTTKASARMISGLTRSFDTCYRTLHAWRCRTRARLASGWRAAPLPGGSRTLWTVAKGFSSFSRSSSFPGLLTLPKPIICEPRSTPHLSPQLHYGLALLSEKSDHSRSHRDELFWLAP